MKDQINKKVYSFNENIRIIQSKQHEAFLALKDKFKFHTKMKEASNLEEALAVCNWGSTIDPFNGCLTLRYEANDWPIRAELALNVLAPFVIKGGSIKISNERRKIYYNYIHENDKFIRRHLIQELIDFDSKEQLKSLFIRSARNLMRLGETSSNLKKILREIFVNSILD